MSIDRFAAHQEALRADAVKEAASCPPVPAKSRSDPKPIKEFMFFFVIMIVSIFILGVLAFPFIFLSKYPLHAGP
jgi:hypothetical protein